MNIQPNINKRIRMLMKLRRPMVIFVLTIFFLILMSSLCFAYSPDSPTIIIIVPRAPSDIDITLNVDGNQFEGLRDIGFMETQYYFHGFKCNKSSEFSIDVSYNGFSDVITLDATYNKYINAFELNYRTFEIKKDVSRKRVRLFAVLSIFLVMSVEALVFFSFGFRERKSWLVFLVINLVIQGIFNNVYVVLSGTYQFMLSMLLFGGLYLFLFEGAGIVLLVEEKREGKRFAYVMVANLLGLVVVAALIPFMPFYLK